MDILLDIVTNRYLYIPILLWFIIQIFKFITDFAINKKVNFKRLLGAGGMPSSHTAVVTSLAVLVGKSEGFDTAIFAIAVVFAFIVMYDAAGIRRAAGKQAKLLNRIIETPGLNMNQVQERLVEVLGHTPFQVLVGAMIGIIAGLLL